MMSTTMMSAHGRRATMGIDTAGSSKRGVGGRDAAGRGAPLGT